MNISVVTTMYCSAGFIAEFYRQVKELPLVRENEHEIIFVDDGSPDNSLEVARKIAENDSNVKVLELSKNFGHHNAMLAGLSHAGGDLIFLIDCDLEVSPDVLAEFYRIYDESGRSIDVVYGYQEERKGGFFEKLSGQLFYPIFNRMCGGDLKGNVLTERLMTREFLDGFLKIGDFNLFLHGLMDWCGFKQIGVPVKKGLREGATTYTPVKRFKLAINAVTSFSGYPLVMLFYAGIAVSLISVMFFLYLAARKIFFPETIVLGFPSIMGFMSLSLGLNFSAIGLVGLYLSKVYSQVQNRPRFIVRKIHCQTKAFSEKN